MKTFLLLFFPLITVIVCFIYLSNAWHSEKHDRE